MLLFGNRQEANLRACAQMIESVLADRGIPPDTNRVENESGHTWELSHGSAKIYVILRAARDGNNFIQVFSPVMIPTPESLNGPAFMRRLLELNAQELSGAAFGLRDEAVVLSADRSTAGLDRVEVEEMIRRVADYADHYDDALTREFGGKRHSDR